MISEEAKPSPKSPEYTQGPVQIHMAGLPYNPNGFPGNATAPTQPVIIVRAEEALIVILVLVLWIAAIALFFNRWGKIRMLEPYQPKFIQQHRPSCPLVDTIQHRSFSKFNISGDPFLNHQRLLRPRQNSVFVGSSLVTLPMNPPRKVKSAFDLQNLILSDPALNKSFTRINFRPDDFRRSSMLPTLNIYSDGFQRHEFELPQPMTGERRLSFKDIVEYEKPPLKYERVQCHMEKEPECEAGKRQRKISETKQKSVTSTQSSMSDSRHNSLTTQEVVKPRRSSVLPNTLAPNIKELDVNELRPEIKSGVNSFRRNSMLLINSFENDRNFLNPRYGSETIKSGVIDFRRNSMLIINNLNEDIGVPSFGRNLSLGGSNVNLGDYPPVVSARRNSVIPPYHAQPKPSIPYVAKPKPTPSKSLSVAVENKYIANQKGSKSLDSEKVKKEVTESPPISELRKQFLMPVLKCTGSTASLNTEVSNLGTNRTIDESRSTGNLSVEKSEFVQPKIIETRCTSPNPDEIKLDELKTDNGFGSQLNLLANEEGTEGGDASESKSKPVVNITSSLSNINITSSIPLNVITSSDTAKRKPNTIQISHV